jgi:hypothetical protein
MITKKLLSEVLQMEVLETEVEDNILIYLTPYKNFQNKNEINIYELAHKCKEWAILLGYELHSKIECTKEGMCDIQLFTSEPGFTSRNTVAFRYGDAEPEAIFRACQWILENKDKK